MEVSQSAIDLLLAQTAQLSPSHLAVHDGEGSAEVVAKQACYLPVGSGDPVIGALRGEEGRGVFVGAGHSCWGITNGEFRCFCAGRMALTVRAGPATGLCLAELVLDGKVKSANISRLGV